MGLTQRIHVYAAQRALERAYADGCHRRFKFVESDGTALEALYETESGAWYFVTAQGCSCPGGARNMICKHVAAALDLAGMLDSYIPGVYGAGQPDHRIAA
jgi:hypothetical protein